MAFRATEVIHVDLPNVNPFASEPRTRRYGGGGSIGWHGRAAQYSDDEESTQVEDRNMAVLPSTNPFAASYESGGSHRSRPAPRLSRPSPLVRHSSEDEGDYPRTGTTTARSRIQDSDTAPTGGLSRVPASRAAANQTRFNGVDQSDEPVSQRVDNPRRPRQPARPVEDDGDLVTTLVNDVPPEQPFEGK